MKSRSSLVSQAVFLTSAFAAAGVIALTTGCASGGFKLTRQYASFVNSQNIIIRILLYIFTSPVFLVTLIVDLVINNTIDFWNGTVAAGTYNFEKDGKHFVVHHEILPATKLKRSTIEVKDLNGKLLQTVVIRETEKSEIEFLIDGQLRTRVSHISDLPVAAIYDAKGSLVQDGVVVSMPAAQLAMGH